MAEVIKIFDQLHEFNLFPQLFRREVMSQVLLCIWLSAPESLVQAQTLHTAMFRM
jgi:hypothetical protein